MVSERKGERRGKRRALGTSREFFEPELLDRRACFLKARCPHQVTTRAVSQHELATSCKEHEAKKLR